MLTVKKKFNHIKVNKNMFYKKKYLKIFKFKNIVKNDKYVFDKIKLNNNYRFFIYKIFKSTIKNGKKIKAFNNFAKIIFKIKQKIFQPDMFFKKIFKKSVSTVDYRVQSLGNTKYRLPYISNRNRALSKSVSLLINSVKTRHETNYLLRLNNELFDIFYGKGLTIEKKKDFYINFFKEKSFRKFIKFYKHRYKYRPNFISIFNKNKLRIKSYYTLKKKRWKR